jgi:hypothetical protein
LTYTLDAAARIEFEIFTSDQLRKRMLFNLYEATQRFRFFSKASPLSRWHVANAPESVVPGQLPYAVVDDKDPFRHGFQLV